MAIERITEVQKKNMLRELLLDGDWSAAAKRAGLVNRQAEHLRNNALFMEKAKGIIEKAGIREVKEAENRFRRTQEVLMQELEGGNMAVASTLMKSHEIEFRKHGMFEKDNKQKGQSVMINISLSGEQGQKVIQGGSIDAEEG